MIKITKQPIKGASLAEVIYVFLSRNFMDRKHIADHDPGRRFSAGCQIGKKMDKASAKKAGNKRAGTARTLG